MYFKFKLHNWFDVTWTWSHDKSCGLSRRLWLSATLSRAKAIVGPSPMARPGPAQTGSAWPGSRLWARPGKSLIPNDPPSKRQLIEAAADSAVIELLDSDDDIIDDIPTIKAEPHLGPSMMIPISSKQIPPISNSELEEKPQIKLESTQSRTSGIGARFGEMTLFKLKIMSQQRIVKGGTLSRRRSRLIVLRAWQKYRSGGQFRQKIPLLHMSSI